MNLFSSVILTSLKTALFQSAQEIDDASPPTKYTYIQNTNHRHSVSMIFIFTTYILFLYVINTRREFVDIILVFELSMCKLREYGYQAATLSRYPYSSIYVYSVTVHQKYLTRLLELIMFEPWREYYHFSLPS